MNKEELINELYRARSELEMIHREVMVVLRRLQAQEVERVKQEQDAARGYTETEIAETLRRANELIDRAVGLVKEGRKE